MKPTPPLPPVFTLISVQPETGNTEFTWTSSPSPQIAAYIINTYKNNSGLPVDTVWDPGLTKYVISNTSTKYSSVSYVLNSIRIPICKSEFSNVLSTIFCTTSIDTCSNQISLSWNSYSSFPVRVIDYSVLVSINGGAFSEVIKLPSDKTSFILKDFLINSDYCFVIRANLEGGLFSTSRKSCLSTKMQHPPAWINADYATISDDKKITLSFTIDPLSELKNYKIERKNSISGNYSIIGQFTSPEKKIKYTDNLAKPDSAYIYRLSSINNCNLPVTISNTASNIHLVSQRNGENISFKWNHYKQWNGVLSSYKLYVNTGSGYDELESISPLDSSYTLDYKRIMYRVSGPDLCFYIQAAEASNPYGVNGISNSSVTCLQPGELVTVPNTFTPNNDLINDLFKPVLSFTPVTYQFVISDRNGKVLFETRDFTEQWDGTRNGDPVPQGVCLWF